jgi:hypothetical protein
MTLSVVSDLSHANDNCGSDHSHQPCHGNSKNGNKMVHTATKSSKPRSEMDSSTMELHNPSVSPITRIRMAGSGKGMGMITSIAMVNTQTSTAEKGASGAYREAEERPQAWYG